MRKRYYGGPIVTMEDSMPLAEILVTNDGRIEYVGPDRAEYQTGMDEAIDLGGKCLMPGLIDAHSHFLSVAGSFLQIQLKDIADLEEIADRITDYIRQNDLPPEAWIQAVGYDQTVLPGGQHPTRQFLDSICPDHPLVMQHISGHMGVLNTMALKALGIENAPEDENTHPEIGLLQETAFVDCLRKIPSPDFGALLAACGKAHGITTVQEGMMVKEMIPIYQGLLASGLLALDVIAYADMKDGDQVYSAFSAQYPHFRLGGYKIFLDGSPQGGTAWMRQPYEGTNSCGISTMSDEAVLAAARAAATADRQLLAHCNGDAACGQFLTALETAAQEYTDLPKTRPVLIHAQLIGRDQLPTAKKVGAVASFFVSHVHHWGDVHIRKFGMERASGISPARSALALGIPVTFHTDSPVIPPNLMEAVSCAVNRRTKAGVILGAEEAISVQEALKAITIGSAYQYFEENEKGSLLAGKQADLVILDRDPLDTPAEALADIRVMQTIQAGNVIYTCQE